ncbi:MAG: LamG-like jellyroll fold domain-containing protein [Candidatus Paracaedibacteraceae bacterium]|nr:LamG-like jellyroll fold domain-containing protein [Candidatus Paracaedibacteraceae bacterium]
MQRINVKDLHTDIFPELKAQWNFSDTEISVPDVSKNGHMLFPVGNPKFTKDPQLFSAANLNGRNQWLSSTSAIINTNESFSVAIWVRLSGELLNNEINLEEGRNALTAVSQNSKTHAGFYLGLRKYKENQLNETPKIIYKWCFALAPISMDFPGIHACSSEILSTDNLNKWTFLVAVCDIENRCIKLYIPTSNQFQNTPIPTSWVLWNATNEFQIGRGQWDGVTVDQWPGSIGPTRVYKGALSFEQSKVLYHQDIL